MYISYLQLKLGEAKAKKYSLNKSLELAEIRLQKSEDNYYKKSQAVCDHESVIRSIAAKICHAKRKTKLRNK